MAYLDYYIAFCNKFHTIRLPKIKFKTLNERYKQIYRSYYNIDFEDINKSNFIIFLSSFGILLLILYPFTANNFIMNLILSLVTSVLLSYKNSSIIYRRTQIEEKKLDAAVYLIKIYFSLVQTSLPSDSDYIIHFINMIKGYNLPLSSKFNEISNLVQIGEKPEYRLYDLMTPSKEMNRYINNLLTTDFRTNIIIDNYGEKSLEKRFNIFLKQVDTKLSVIFFISLFLPIALSILLIFREILLLYIFPILAAYYFILKSLNRKFLKEDFFLFGALQNYSKHEKERFNQFLSFLTIFALNLSKNLSPELAFINSYSILKSKYDKLCLNFDNKLSRLLNLSISFEQLINEINIEMETPRFKIILDVLIKLLTLNSYFSNEKIFEILDIISKHQKLERKFENILKGERFKVMLYIFLLPIIVGGIGGLFPIFNLTLADLTNVFDKLELLMNFDSIIIYMALLISILISNSIFLNVIKIKKKLIFIVYLWLLYTFSFFCVSLSILNLY